MHARGSGAAQLTFFFVPPLQCACKLACKLGKGEHEGDGGALLRSAAACVERAIQHACLRCFCLYRRFTIHAPSSSLYHGFYGDQPSKWGQSPSHFLSLFFLMPRLTQKKSRVVDDETDADVVFEDDDATAAGAQEACALKRNRAHTPDKGASKKLRADRADADDTDEDASEDADEEDEEEDEGSAEEDEGSAEEDEGSAEEKEEEEAPRPAAAAAAKKRSVVDNGDDDGTYKGPVKYRKMSAALFRKWHAAQAMDGKNKARFVKAETRFNAARAAFAETTVKRDAAHVKRRTPAQLHADVALIPKRSAADRAMGAALLPAPVVNAMIDAAVLRKEHADAASCVYMPCCFKVIARAAAANAAVCPACAFLPITTQVYTLASRAHK